MDSTIKQPPDLLTEILSRQAPTAETLKWNIYEVQRAICHLDGQDGLTPKVLAERANTCKAHRGYVYHGPLIVCSCFSWANWPMFRRPMENSVNARHILLIIIQNPHPSSLSPCLKTASRCAFKSLCLHRFHRILNSCSRRLYLAQSKRYRKLFINDAENSLRKRFVEEFLSECGYATST